MGFLQAILRRLKAWMELVQSRTFVKELVRTITAWATLFIIGIWMVICQQWSDMRWIKRLKEQGLYSNGAKPTKWPIQVMLQDQVLESLPILHKAWISDKLVGTSVIICILGCSFLAIGWRQRMMLIRRIAWMVGILYFIRSVTLSVTTLPPSIDTCEITVPQSMWQVVKATPDILAGNIGQCTDKVFSGHTSILVISTLFWLRYSTHWGFILYSVVHCTLGIISVLLARYHYTVDVLIGFFLTFFVHQMYYTALDQAIRQKDVGRSNRLAWQKMRNSAVYDNDDNGYDSQVYRMSVIPRNHNTDTDESMWRDQDSAVGVDISGRVTPHRQQQQQQNLIMTNDDRAFVVRKRETSTATTAHSVYSDAANDPVDVSLMAPVPQIASSNGISQVVHHCEIAMVQLDDRGKNDQNRESEESGLFSNDSDMEEEEEGLPFVQRIRMQSTSPHRLDIMGINRPFGSFLPAVVAWMDGLDIRYN